MKKLKILVTLSIFLLGFTISCVEEGLPSEVPNWESAIHGLAVYSAGSPENFIKGDPSKELSIDFSWNSIDGKLTVTKVEVYALFSEAYTDNDGNAKTAKHGGDDGKLLMTLDGAAVPADKATTTFTISQDDIYALYSANTYDYYGTGALPVWGAGSIRADRTTADFKFVDGDSFSIRWEMTTDDGRVFSKWGTSVCTEFPGANCAVEWSTVCSQVIKDPVGTWTFDLIDYYGDGWQGGYISVVANGTEIATPNIPDYWDTGLGPYSAYQVMVDVPAGTTTLTFAWSKDTYQSECGFSIKSPKGNVIAKYGPAPPEGTLTLDLCVENQ